jgi:hypothetical protein
MPGRRAWGVVDAEEPVDGEPLEQAVIDHRLGRWARLLGGPRSIAMWPSCPQACIAPALRETHWTPLSSVMARASSSERSPTVRPDVPRVSDATSPVPPMPVSTMYPSSPRTRET